MCDSPVNVSWRNPSSANRDSLEGLRMMPPITKLRPFDDPSKLYPWVWITQCEMFFKDRRIPQSAWLNRVRGLLGGEIKTWFNRLLRERKGSVTWEEFRFEICDAFGNDDPVDVFRRFRECVQEEDESLKDFWHRWLRMWNLLQFHTQGRPERLHLYVFVSGMRNSLNYMVRMLEPTSLVDSYEKGLWIEENYGAYID